MELVQMMLKVAMKEESEEDDTVRDEYERKFDENLADLKGKLYEARREEGKEPRDLEEAAKKEVEKEEETVVTADTPVVDDSKVKELEERLAAEQEKVREIGMFLRELSS